MIDDLIFLFSTLVIAFFIFLSLEKDDRIITFVSVGTLMIILCIEFPSIKQVFLHLPHSKKFLIYDISLLCIMIVQILIAFLISYFCRFIVHFLTFKKSVKIDVSFIEKYKELDHFPLILEGSKNRFDNFLDKMVMIDGVTKGKILEFSFHHDLVRVEMTDTKQVINFDDIFDFFLRIQIISE